MNTRRQALDALCDITDRGAYANLRVKQLMSSLPEREAKLAAALVYHTLDHLLTIDYYLAHFVKGAQKPIIRGILLGASATSTTIGAFVVAFRDADEGAAPMISLDLDSLVAGSDAAMLRAKKGGKNAYVFARPQRTASNAA